MNGVLRKLIYFGLALGLAVIFNTTSVSAGYVDGYEYFVTTANLRLRTGPSLYCDIIRTVPQGTRVRVYDQRDGEWFSASHNGTAGYMNWEFLRPFVADTYIEETYPPLAAEPPAEDHTAQEVDRPPEPQISDSGVELVNWSYASHNIIRNGVPLHITDVRTGRSFWMQAFSQGRHADVVPISREDTEEFRATYNGRWCWTPRAIWVTVDGRTFAASISGMPHGGFNSLDNGLTGHFCLHFEGSRTHNGNRSHERDHQNRVQDAFRAR